MRILAPVNNPNEVKRLIQAGASEVYCGVMPDEWREKYTNLASPNRREWKTANLSGFESLQEVVDTAHAYNAPVNLALNGLYTARQYPLLFKQVEAAKKFKVDALIVADLGVILTLKKEKIDLEIHISTGGTTFNSETAMFYQDLGAERVILPRHLKPEEIEKIVRACPDMDFEVFILNSGCKNIDGFCTFQHGVNEILHREFWNFPKKINFDRHFLNIIRRLPLKAREGLPAGIFGIDSACLLNYRVRLKDAPKDFGKKEEEGMLKNIASSFSLLSACDTCGACCLDSFKKMGVYAVKIVGRNYSTAKKARDIKFLKTILSSLDDRAFSREEFKPHVKSIFRKVYGMDCGRLCYFPEG